MSVESEHILEAGERASIRRSLSMLVDAYEKEMKRVEDNLGSEDGCALLRAEKNSVIELRIKFADPGSLVEVEAAQDDLFDGDDPLETDGTTEVVGDITPDIGEAFEAAADQHQQKECDSWPVDEEKPEDDAAAEESDDEAEEPEPFEGTAAGHLDE